MSETDVALTVIAAGSHLLLQLGDVDVWHSVDTGFKTAKVQCVDSGSVHDIVDVSKIRRLCAELLSKPPFAFECQLFGVTSGMGIICSVSLLLQLQQQPLLLVL